MISARKIVPFERVFASYTRWYFKRNFHGLHLLGEIPVLPDEPELPLIVCMNHSGWWDVLIGVYLASEKLGWRQWYGVMDERQLQRYRFFSWLGMIGVDRTTISGVKEFLAYAQKLMCNRKVAVWVTPQGEIVSNTVRPLVLQPGVGALAASLPGFHLLTVTIHYEFWDEPKPEAFVSFSSVKTMSALESRSRKVLLSQIEAQMTSQLDTLMLSVQSRDYADFTPLLIGKSGIAALYDVPRALYAKLSGKEFTSEHSGVNSPRWKEKMGRDRR